MDETTTTYEYTVSDGSITIGLTFNTEQDSYSPKIIEELCQVLEHTAASLRFSLNNPDVSMPVVLGRPS